MRSGLIVGVIALAACKWSPHKYDAGTGSSQRAGSAADSNGWIIDRVSGDRVAVLALGGSSATDVYAVGDNLLAHFDGASWTDVAPASFRCRDCSLQSISVAAPDDVWAVGKYGRVAHFDGKAWTITQLDLLRDEHAIGGYVNLSHVVAWHGRGAIASIAADRQLIRFDGTRWTKLPVANGWADVFWGAAPDDLWEWERSSRFEKTMHHFDGTAWQEPVGPVSGSSIARLDGSGPSDIWAVGGTGGGHSSAVAYHFDGKAWSDVHFTDFTSALSDIDVIGPNEAYAAGGSVVAWDGTAWKSIPGPQAFNGSLAALYAAGGGHLFVSKWEDSQVAHK